MFNEQPKEFNKYPVTAQELKVKFGETNVRLLYMPDIMGGVLIAFREDDKDDLPLFRMDMDGMVLFNGSLTPKDSLTCGKNGQLRIRNSDGIMNPTKQEEWDGMTPILGKESNVGKERVEVATGRSCKLEEDN